MRPLEDEALSMAFPWSSKTVRSRRKALTIFCCGCGQREDTLDRPLRYCSMCQVASYCSKECQKSDWPEHKPICGAAGIPKLIKSLMANPDLLVPLGGCFILAFDLIDCARCSEPLFARLDVALEPSDIFNCAKIFLGLGEGTLASRSGSKKAGKGKNYDGMLQVNAFTPITNPKRITDSHRVVWQCERAKADAAGYRANEVVLMDIFHADGQMSMTIPMQLSPGLKDLTTRDPCTIETSIQILNAYIRADRKNKMLLRAQMRPADLQVIRDAVTDPKTAPAIMLLTKISREPIYQPMYQVFVEARTAATGVVPSIPVLNLL
ncbi:hypothetical protein DFH08DRAFT_887440 [Mycena albidolilacea]|uniref:MYND-type domain-containing protein n=1 Tax=Mycena albidolilacea TaxID=1033008 RepID=A0AAD6ZHW7_9AGAR|nr:hypothetical protein DFH08DRAFT_887440 [Mycena albidolilacea]